MPSSREGTNRSIFRRFRSVFFTCWEHGTSSANEVLALETKNAKMMQIKNEQKPGAASEQIETALRRHWAASAAGNQNLEHEIYDEHVICNYPQSGESIHGRGNLQNLRSHHPGKPTGFSIRRLFGSGKLWITEYTIAYQDRSFYTVSIMEFENGKVVRETQYFAEPFDPPGWRAQWVEPMETDRKA
jgi:hypothetical protein